MLLLSCPVFTYVFEFEPVLVETFTDWEPKQNKWTFTDLVTMYKFDIKWTSNLLHLNRIQLGFNAKNKNKNDGSKEVEISIPLTIVIDPSNPLISQVIYNDFIF